MAAAVRILAAPRAPSLARERSPVPGGGDDHRLPAYDRGGADHRDRAAARLVLALRQEARHRAGDVRDELHRHLGAAISTPWRPTPPVWTLRDYHSPNLLWLPEREGDQRVGIIDTQDCVLGPSGLRPRLAAPGCARRRSARSIIRRLLDYYCACGAAIRASMKRSFRRAYAILGAQRATKILGIFARLSRRDGKHGYLRHMPRVSRYLEAQSRASRSRSPQGVVRPPSAAALARAAAAMTGSTRDGAGGGPRRAHAAADAHARRSR